MPNFINHLAGKDRNALHGIKNIIAAKVRPLLIFCFACETVVRSRRNCFVRKLYSEERHFTCRLLVVTPDEMITDTGLETELQEMTAHLGAVQLFIHPISGVQRQMKLGNLFFCWVQQNGMLLYERNGAAQLLPQPIGRAYRRQAEQFYHTDPQMRHYREVRIQAVEKKPVAENQASPMKPLEIRLVLDAVHGWQPLHPVTSPASSGHRG